MKFCYVDESGAGSEPVIVMAGIIVDSTRMHKTKSDFNLFLKELSKICKRQIIEFHTREFYNGNGPWRNIDGLTRVAILDFLLDWLKERRHDLTFTAIEKIKFNKRFGEGCKFCKDLGTAWRACAFHLILSIQKYHQPLGKTTGYTALVFDQEYQEEQHLLELVSNPPIWADDFYNKKRKEERLNRIVDIPYFADSEHVLLLQMADLIAYLLRIKSEKELGVRTGYKDESERIQGWINKISSMIIPSSNRWPARTSSACAKLFNELVPESLRSI